MASASAAPARAAAGDPREQAAAHYARGIDLAKQGLYEAALEQFNQAYATSPHFAVLYNIGQAQIALGRPLAAIEALATYLRDGAEKVPLSRREQVQAQIALLEAKLGELTISTERPGVAIRVDDRDIGRTPLYQPIRLAAGTHTITATPPDGAQITRVVTLAEAERRRLELAFAGEAPHDAATPAAAPCRHRRTCRGAGGGSDAISTGSDAGVAAGVGYVARRASRARRHLAARGVREHRRRRRGRGRRARRLPLEPRPL